MPQQQTHLTILFADVCQSTRLFETQGDLRARQIIAGVLQEQARIVAEQGGTLVKTIGDEIMCTFPNPEQAIFAATQMQEVLSQPLPAFQIKISIKVGLHHGEVIQEQGDVFGDAVNVAARMVSVARPDQIITTAATVDSLPSYLRGSMRSLGRVSVRGKQEPIEIYEIIWLADTSNLTVMQGTTPSAAHPTRAELQLRYGGGQYALREDQGAFYIGRGEKNHLVVDEGLVSRSHATIEFRGGKFVLSDHSTNGTYLITESGERLRLHREQTPLYGQGIISLGQEVPPGHPYAIQYTCRS